MNIKDIALKVANSLDSSYGLGARTTSNWPIAFAEALVAELAKQNKPIGAEMTTPTREQVVQRYRESIPAEVAHSGAVSCSGRTRINYCALSEAAFILGYETARADLEATIAEKEKEIEQETAEAIAALVDFGYANPVKEIRAGTWKEYK